MILIIVLQESDIITAAAARYDCKTKKHMFPDLRKWEWNHSHILFGFRKQFSLRITVWLLFYRFR